MNFWKKIKKIFVPETPDSEGEEKEELVIFGKEDPIDVQFTKNFIAGGGNFFYCENEQEVLVHLKEVIDYEHIYEIICFDKELKSLLNRVSIKTTENHKDCQEFAFLKCEYLAAFNGVIMLSSDQTRGNKQDDLPQNIIVYAHPEQIVPNLSDALQKLRRAKKNELPSNITSLKGNGSHGIDSANAKTIYLLLVEKNK